MLNSYVVLISVSFCIYVLLIDKGLSHQLEFIHLFTEYLLAPLMPLFLQDIGDTAINKIGQATCPHETYI